jgi:hypothetical protein
MKDARGGTHSLAESVVPLPARHGLIELIGHSAALSPSFTHQRCGITRWWNLRLAQGGSVVACNAVAVGLVALMGKPQAGSLNDSPLVSTAQAMRAFFAAMATSAYQ